MSQDHIEHQLDFIVEQQARFSEDLTMASRFVIFLCISLATFFALSCFKAEPTLSTGNTNTPAASGSNDAQKLSAARIIEEFKSAGLPIGAVAFYTEENDPNKLLGRPGQYIEKARWEDKRVKQIRDYGDYPDPEGGGMEVFNSLQELERRKAYLEQPLPIGPPLVEYRYILGTALIRLDKDLTPKQAAEYEAVVNRMKEQMR